MFDMLRITTDDPSFEGLRKDGYVYVDKAGLLWHPVALVGVNFRTAKRNIDELAVERLKGVLE